MTSRPSNTDFIFDVSANVSQADMLSINQASQIAQEYLGKVGGGAIPASIQSQMVIKVVATGLGDRGGGGAVATTSTS